MDSVGKQPLGCCGETIINLSLLTMPKNPYLDFNDFSLWCTMAVIFVEPYFKSIVGFLEMNHQLFSYFFGPTLAFFLYIMASYMYSVWAFMFFNVTLLVQPKMLSLQRTDFLVIGYILLLFGLGVKIVTYISTSISKIMGGHYFKIRRASVREAGPSSYDLYYHSLGTTSVMCYFGFSLIHGSIAGLFLSIVLALAYFLAFHFERFLVLVSYQQSSQPLIHEMNHSRIPPPIRSNKS